MCEHLLSFLYIGETHSKGLGRTVLKKSAPGWSTKKLNFEHCSKSESCLFQVVLSIRHCET